MRFNVPESAGGFIGEVRSDFAKFRDRLAADQLPRVDAALADLAALSYLGITDPAGLAKYAAEMAYVVSELESERSLAEIRVGREIRFTIGRTLLRLAGVPL